MVKPTSPGSSGKGKGKSGRARILPDYVLKLFGVERWTKIAKEAFLNDGAIYGGEALKKYYRKIRSLKKKGSDTFNYFQSKGVIAEQYFTKAMVESVAGLKKRVSEKQ